LTDAFNEPTIRAIMDLELIPFGLAEPQDDKSPIPYDCQHGHDECRGILSEVCVMNAAKDIAKYFPILGCAEAREARDDPAGVMPDCVKKAGLDYAPIQRCIKGKKGQKLVRVMEKKTSSLGEGGNLALPYIQVNGRNNDDAQSNLIAEVCRLYRGKKPSICDKQDEKEIADKDVRKGKTSLLKCRVGDHSDVASFDDTGSL